MMSVTAQLLWYTAKFFKCYQSQMLVCLSCTDVLHQAILSSASGDTFFCIRRYSKAYFLVTLIVWFLYPQLKFLFGANKRKDIMTYRVLVYLFLSSLSIFTSLTIIQHTESKAELTTSLPSVPTSKLQGVNLLDPVLIRTSFGPPYYLGNPPPVNTSLHLIKSYGFNFVRIPYYWESYQANPGSVPSRS